MHVGAAARDLAQSRRLEGVLHLDDAGQVFAAPDILARQTDILETVIGEIPALVAGRALRLGVEDDEAALGLFGDRLLVALDPGVERRTLRDDGPLIGRDRLGKRLRPSCPRRESRGEQRLVFGNRCQGAPSACSSGMFISPGDWIGPSACSSRLASRPSHMKIAPQAALTMVGEWRPSLASVADADRQAVAPAEARAVTARAGLRRGHRKARVEIQLLAERGLFRRIGIFLGNGIVAGRLYCAFSASMPAGAFWPISMRRVSPTIAAPRLVFTKPNRPSAVAARTVPDRINRP